MDINSYVESMRQSMKNAAELADSQTQEVAARLGHVIDSSFRLALIGALSDAAANLSAELAPTSVDVRVSGGDPEFVVTVPAASAEPTLLIPADEPDDLGEAETDEPLARISLRLPASVKTRVDEVAARDGVSTNAWLIRAVVDALSDRPRGARRGAPWGAAPPMPPVPVPPPPFDFPFGSPQARDDGRHRRPGTAGGVQGWAR